MVQHVLRRTFWFTFPLMLSPRSRRVHAWWIRKPHLSALVLCPQEAEEATDAAAPEQTSIGQAEDTPASTQTAEDEEGAAAEVMY